MDEWPREEREVDNVSGTGNRLYECALGQNLLFTENIFRSKGKGNMEFQALWQVYKYFILGGSGVVRGRLGRYMPHIILGVSLAHDTVPGEKASLLFLSC